MALKLQRACLSDSTTGNPLKIRKVKPKPPKQSKPQRLSLFHELFPEQKDSREDDKESKVDKLPPFQFDTGFEQTFRKTRERPPVVGSRWTTDKGDDAAKRPPPIRQNELEDQKRRREPAVLVLNSASKRLEESDFFRIGHKGTHIQGWTTGIIKGMDDKLCDEVNLMLIVRYSHPGS